MNVIQSDDRTNDCQKQRHSLKSSKLLLTTQVLFCILKTVLHLNIKSHTKLCVSTRSIKSPRFNSNGTKSVLQIGKGGGGVRLFNSISFYLRRHHTRSFASHLPLPKSSQTIDGLANFITRGKQYATIDKRRAVVWEGGVGVECQRNRN